MVTWPLIPSVLILRGPQFLRYLERIPPRSELLKFGRLSLQDSRCLILSYIGNDMTIHTLVVSFLLGEKSAVILFMLM